jgi:hypothetical protein
MGVGRVRFGDWLLMSDALILPKCPSNAEASDSPLGVFLVNDLSYSLYQLSCSGSSIQLATPIEASTSSVRSSTVTPNRRSRGLIGALIWVGTVLST